MMRKVIRNIFPISLILVLIQPVVHAAGACRGLDETSCVADPSCRWINSYKMKTGEWIEGYCRVKPGMKAPPYESRIQEINRNKTDDAVTEIKANERSIEKGNIKIRKREKYEKKYHSEHEEDHYSDDHEREHHDEYEREHSEYERD